MIRVHGRNKLGTYAEIIRVIVWFRPSCISYIFHICYYYFFTSCIFGSHSFLSVVLLFYGGQFSGLVAFLVTVK